MVMLISHHKYECAVIVFFTDVMIVHMVNDCITSRPLWPVAKRIKIARSSKQSFMIFTTGNCVRVYLSEITLVKWPKLSLLVTLSSSPCVCFLFVFVCFLWAWSVSLFIYLFILFINLLLLIYNTAQCKLEAGSLYGFLVTPRDGS